MLVGLIGIVLPVLPGLVLVWAGVALWSSEKDSAGGWMLLGVATVLLVVGMTTQYSLPRRRMQQAGVPARTSLVGALCALVGFFVVPVVGLFAGFVLGVYVAERTRLRGHAAAWPSTVAALRAVALSMGIELVTGMAIIAAWVSGLLLLGLGT